MHSSMFPDVSPSPRPHPNQGLKPRYDFIVIGSGSSGCAVAARLARAAPASPATVLLVEAGGEAQRSGRTQQARQAFSCWQSAPGADVAVGFFGIEMATTKQ